MQQRSSDMCCDDAGRAAPLFGAMSLGMNAARSFSRAISSSRRSTQAASLHRLAATSQQSAGETTSGVIQPLEIEVVYDPPSHDEQEYESEEEMMRRILEQYTDEEWRAMAKVCARPWLEVHWGWLLISNMSHVA